MVCKHVTGIHIGLEALADVPLEKVRQQLEVNVVAQISVIQARHVVPFPTNEVLRRTLHSHWTGWGQP